MFATAAKGNMWNDFVSGGTHFLSLHTAYSRTGANELTGGAYARKQITAGDWTVSGGTVSNDSGLDTTFDIPSASTVRFIGRWDASTAGNFQGMTPLSGAPFEFYVDTANDTIERASHGLSNGAKIVFMNTPPGGLTEGTLYFVVGATTDDFQVSATSGGSAINLTSQGADDCTCSRVVEEEYFSAGTLVLPNLALTYDCNF